MGKTASKISTDPKKVKLALVLFWAQKPVKDVTSFAKEYKQFAKGAGIAEGRGMFYLAQELTRNAVVIELALRDEARQARQGDYAPGSFDGRMLEKHPFLKPEHLNSLHGYACGENWRD
jgi:hypothetical protein